MPRDDISQYSKEELIEKCRSNPFFFIRNFCKIKHPTEGIIYFDLYDYQEEISKEILGSDDKLFSIVKSRQLGVSTLMAGLALWIATFRSGVEIAIVSTKFKTAKNISEKVKLMYDTVPKFLRQKAKKRNVSEFEFENESKISCLTHNKNDGVRSLSATWIIIDESAFIEDMTGLWTTIEPSVDHGEKVIALSSPNGPQGWFYDVCTDAEEEDNPWNKIKLPWHVHPARQHDDGSPNWGWRRGKDKTLGKRKAQQEYDAMFGVSDDTYFDPEFIEFQEKHYMCEPKQKDGYLWVWELPQQGEKYIAGVDCAEGGGDNNSIQVFKVSTMEQVAEYVSDEDYEVFGYQPVRVGRMYNLAHLAIEQNSVGTAVTQRANDLGYENLYFRGTNNDAMALGENKPKVGWKTTSRTRPLAIEAFRSLFESEDGIKIRSQRLIREIKNFIVSNGKPQARNGYTDDSVMACSIGCFIYNTHQFNNEQFGDGNDLLTLMGLANGKAKEDLDKMDNKTFNDVINDREEYKKKRQADNLTGGLDREIREEFNWL